MQRNLVGTWRSVGGPKRLRELRQAQGMTLVDLATKIGVNKGTLSKLENPNLRSSPSLDLIQAVAEGLKVKREALFDSDSSNMKGAQRPLGVANIALELFLRDVNPSSGNTRRFRKVATHPDPPKTAPEWRRFTEWLVLFTGQDPRPGGTRMQSAAKVRSF
jgi:transcriptional regulator with XRE-family HTH domain